MNLLSMLKRVSMPEVFHGIHTLEYLPKMYIWNLDTRRSLEKEFKPLFIGLRYQNFQRNYLSN